MKRRGFMRMLGIAPAVAAIPAVLRADPIPEEPELDAVDWTANSGYVISESALASNGYYYTVTAINGNGEVEPSWPVS